MVALVLVLGPSPASAGVTVQEGESQLEQVQTRVDRVTSRLRAARGDARAAREALADVEEDLDAVEARVNAAAAAVLQQEAAVVAADRRLTALRQEADLLAGQVEDRAVSLFKHGATRSIGAVLAAGDVQEAMDRSAYIDLVTGAGRVELERVGSARVAVAAEADRVEAERARLLELRAREEALLVQVERLRDAQADALGAAEATVDSLASRKDDLQEDVGRIEELIEEAKSTPVAAAPPSTTGYIRPVCSTVTSNFGYRWGRLHAGMDISAPTGTPIGAAREGVVISAGYQGGYGNLVLVDHGNGVVSAYAHMSAVSVGSGQAVARGQRLGLVGSTGNSTGPHLHLETRVNGSPVDPRQFLPSGC